MIILQIASGDFFSTYGGGQVYVKNLVDEMIRQEQNVSVISTVSSIPDDMLWSKKDYNGIDLYEITGLSDADLEKLLSEINPDIIHAHSNKAQVCRVAKRLNIPVVVTSHHGGIVCPAGALMDADDKICMKSVSHKNCLKCCLKNTRTGTGWYPFMKLLPEKTYQNFGSGLHKLPFIPFITPIGSEGLHIKQKKEEWLDIVNNCSLMIAPCNMIADAMAINGLDKSKIVVETHGIPLPESIECDKHDDGIVRFFYVGRICYIKGIHIMLEAFCNLSGINAEMHIIGGASTKSEIRYQKQLKKKYESAHNIIWHGKINADKIFDEIKNLDISVSVPIYMEIFGLNIAEALAIGKPVIASKSGGPEMQITEGKNGWLVEPNDIEALTQVMDLSAKSYKEINPHDCADSVKSIQTHAENLLNIYKFLL